MASSQPTFVGLQGLRADVFHLNSEPVACVEIECPGIEGWRFYWSYMTLVISGWGYEELEDPLGLRDFGPPLQLQPPFTIPFIQGSLRRVTIKVVRGQVGGETSEYLIRAQLRRGLFELSMDPPETATGIKVEIKAGILRLRYGLMVSQRIDASLPKSIMQKHHPRGNTFCTYENKVVYLEAPGVELDKVSLSVNHGHLRVGWTIDPKPKSFLQEVIKRGSYVWKTEVSESLKEEHIKKTTKNGILRMEWPLFPPSTTSYVGWTTRRPPMVWASFN